ncbi:hypothetical protein MO867_17575 [Microbulbifer sp. OS29]|uniref:Transglutaminase-like domain-containing protein n=1 Tax=Microbulbifer okhotskensis TaxID=2926617 RepID=A0A9X2EQX3_9GAMM|nr:transglutaminase domain-containing protein [Microbulbifer okhotskensis]MCO1336145.1 hypothetical protein [Microbulbifer okhotskensis]
MSISRIVFSVVSILFGMFGFWRDTVADSKKVTLSAVITVKNQSDRDVVGYIHRLSMPVEAGLQQSLKEVRYEYPEKIVYKKHKKGDSKYLELKLDIPAGDTIKRKVHFDLLLTSYDYTTIPRGREPYPASMYLQSAKYIESNAIAIRELSLEIQNTFADEDARLRAAFLLPQAIIDYKIQPTKGALAGLESREGDCTEYAALFVALARSMGYPARVTSEFLFTKRKQFKQPNHHAAEVYMNGRWLPVDPNLAQESRFGYGFGRGKVSKITLTRDFTWVWSNLWPKNFRGHVDKAKVTIEWSLQ